MLPAMLAEHRRTLKEALANVAKAAAEEAKEADAKRDAKGDAKDKKDKKEKKEKKDKKPAPATPKIFDEGTVQLVTVCLYLPRLVDAHASSVAYIEEMLTSQLVAAIGRHVTPLDFGTYLTYHHRRLFKPAYAPRPFSFSIRRDLDHSREGVIAIQASPSDGTIAEPINTVVSVNHSAEPLYALRFTHRHTDAHTCTAKYAHTI